MSTHPARLATSKSADDVRRGNHDRPRNTAMTGGASNTGRAPPPSASVLGMRSATS